MDVPSFPTNQSRPLSTQLIHVQNIWFVVGCKRSATRKQAPAVMINDVMHGASVLFDRHTVSVSRGM